MEEKKKQPEKIQEKTKKKSKTSFDLKENKTLIAEIMGAAVVLILIALLLTHACSITKYTVTFESNGGTTITSQKVIENYKVDKPATPTKSGYIFEGWYCNDVLFDFNTKITLDIKLEARWEEIAPIDPDKVTGVTLEQTEAFLAPKGTVTLVAIVSPDTALDKSLKWSSSDTSVATVDANGKVTGVKNGTVVITVTTTDGEFKATANVTVTSENIPVTGVTLNKATLALGTGKTETLKAIVAPAGATNSAVTWSSSDTNIATVDANGKVTAKKEGTATITVTTKDGSKTAKCIVTVKNIAVTGVTLSKTTLSIVEGSTSTLTATIKPTDATNKGVTWSSSDTNIATVDANGKVTAKSVGTATITVTTKDGTKTAKCTVTVTEKVFKYTYKTAKLQADEFSPVYYKVWIYRDGVDITTSVTRITSPFVGTQKESGYFKITDSHYNTLNGGTITILYNGETLTATKG